MHFAVNRIIQGDVLGELKKIPDETINMIISSPPYYGLRDYGTATWEGGNKDCDHLGKPKPTHVQDKIIFGIINQVFPFYYNLYLRDFLLYQQEDFAFYKQGEGYLLLFDIADIYNKPVPA